MFFFSENRFQWIWDRISQFSREQVRNKVLQEAKYYLHDVRYKQLDLNPGIFVSSNYTIL